MPRNERIREGRVVRDALLVSTFWSEKRSARRLPGPALEEERPQSARRAPQHGVNPLHAARIFDATYSEEQAISAPRAAQRVQTAQIHSPTFIASPGGPVPISYSISAPSQLEKDASPALYDGDLSPLDFGPVAPTMLDDAHAGPISRFFRTRSSSGAQALSSPQQPSFTRRLPFGVPRCKEDITAEWCTACFLYQGYLRAGEAVLEVEVKPIGVGEGEFSDLVMVNIERVQGEAERLPRSMIAKFSPPHMQGTPLRQVFGSEAHFYYSLTVESGGLNRPEAVLIAARLRRCGASRYFFLLQNANSPLAPALSFKRIDGCTSLPHLMVALRALARFHANWWGANPGEGPLKWVCDPKFGGGALPRAPAAVGLRAWALAIKAGMKALPYCFDRKKPGPVLGEEYRQLYAKLCVPLRRRRISVVRELFRPPLTLVHGDAHVENIFFAKHFEGGCMFIDFGLTMMGQALSDVCMLVACGMPIEARRTHELELLQHYHRCLISFGVTDYSFEQCWRDYQFQLFRPFLSLLVLLPGFARQRRRRKGMFAASPSEGDSKLLAMYEAINSRLAAALHDHAFVETVSEMELTAPPCGWCRPCC